METVTLNAQIRNELGTQANKRLRRADIIPGIVIRKGKSPLNVKVLDRELLHALHTSAGENVVIKMVIADEKNKSVEKNVILQQLQHDPVRDSVTHVDFREISLKEKVHVQVRVETRGDQDGTVTSGGIIDHIMWEIPVECLPTNIPEKIIVDIGHMQIGDAIHIKDVTIPEGSVCLAEPDQVVIACEAPKAAEPEETAEEEAAEGAEPEVLKQKSEEGAEDASAKPDEKKRDKAEGKKEE